MKTKFTLLACWFICSASVIFAQPGTLDNTFGTSGKVTTLAGSECYGYATAVQPDGKIVVAGSYGNSSTGNYDFVIVRYNANGTVDNTFGTSGKVGVDFFGNSDFASAIAIQPKDHKIVVAGSSGTHGAIARLTPNGGLDNSFNSGGKKIIDFGGTAEEIHSVALQPDGKIVLAGYSPVGNTYYTAVARLNGSDGQFDGSFGQLQSGRVTTLVGQSSAGFGVAIQTDGKIVVTGDYLNGSDKNFFVDRYNSNGALDNTFGTNGDGKRGINFGGNDFAKSISIQNDGKIVVAGYSTNSGSNYFAITKLSVGGKLISNFGVGGKVTTLVGNSAFGYSLAIQTNGKIVVAGYALNGNNDFALVRYNANGSLDNGFGTNGVVTTDFGHPDFGYSVALQKDGKIVVAGTSHLRIVVARYNGDPVSQTASSENISDATDKKLSASPTIKLFPNPAKDILSIDGMKASSTKTISIVDMNGRIVQTITTGNSAHTWNIASLPAGTYYLLIDDKKKRTSLKFVKE